MWLIPNYCHLPYKSKSCPWNPNKQTNLGGSLALYSPLLCEISSALNVRFRDMNSMAAYGSDALSNHPCICVGQFPVQIILPLGGVVYVTKAFRKI